MPYVLIHILKIAAVFVGAMCALNLLVFFIPHFWWRRDQNGDPACGLVIWVEPLRFMGIRWGEKSAALGLRRAGYAGEFLFWPWHASWQGTLLLPALRNKPLIEERAKELALFLAYRRAERPDTPIYLMGYSAGGQVARRALELLDASVQVDAAALLSSSFCPWADLRPAAKRVKGPLLVSSSLLDCWIGGVGTTILGNADGWHGPAIGTLGYCGPKDAQIIQRRWWPGLLVLGLLGMHDWSLQPGFLQHFAARDLKITKD